MRYNKNNALRPLSFFSRIKNFFWSLFFFNPNNRNRGIVKTQYLNKQDERNIIMNNLRQNIETKEINQFVDNLAYSRYRGVSYATIGNLAREILMLPGRNLPWGEPKFEKKISKQEAIETTLSFFKSIDEEFYDKVQRVLAGKDENVDLTIYEDENDKELYHTSSNVIDPARVEYQNNKRHIYIPLYGDIDDVYHMVHEFSHMFDLTDPSKISTSRKIFADVTSYSFERMLDCYFESRADNDDILKRDIQKQKEQGVVAPYFFALEYLVKYSFFDYKNRNGELSSEDIKSINSKFFMSPSEVRNQLEAHKQDLNYPARYLLAGIASQEYIQEYRKNPKDSIKRLKEYMELIQEDKGKEALEKLGVKMDVECLKKQIEIINNREKEEVKDKEVCSD